MYNDFTIIPQHWHCIQYLAVLSSNYNTIKTRKMISKIPPPPPLPKTLKFILPNIPSETSTDDHNLCDEGHDYKTINEVIHPIYHRPPKKIRSDKSRTSLGLIFWTQLTSIMSTIFSFLVILSLLTFIMLFRTSSSQTVQDDIPEEVHADMLISVKELPAWIDK